MGCFLGLLARLEAALLDSLVVPLHIVAVVVVVALAVSCSSEVSTEMCEEAATAQAIAEARWGEEIEAHLRIDADLSAAAEMLFEEGKPSRVAAAEAEHYESAERMLGARVEVILAEAETRRRCG